MKITIHRGTSQIGGSCVEVATDQTRILLDLGMPLDFDPSSSEAVAQKAQAQGWCDGVEAIFISHYHQDHHGFIPVDSAVPVFATEGTQCMMQVGAIFLPFRADYSLINLIKPATKNTPAESWVSRHGDMRVTAFTVDHSAFGACAYLIEAGGKRALYTGDIRTHGPKGILYKLLPREVDCLIIEGTNIGGGKTIRTEKEIGVALKACFAEAPDRLNYIWCSGQNIDRISEIVRAVGATRKTLVVDVYVAACMYEINRLTGTTPSPMWDNIRVLYPWGYQFKDGDPNYCLEFRYRRILPEEIVGEPGRYVVLTRPSMLRYIQRHLSAPAANYIVSIWDGYLPEQPELASWCAAEGIAMPYIHTSGHADRESLRKIADHVNPRRIIPIHTEYKDFFAELFSQPVMLSDDNEVFEV